MMTAVTKMRNDNFFPVTILAGENTPFDKDWNNYSELGWTFWLWALPRRGWHRRIKFTR